jgi:hypothetical protein
MLSMQQARSPRRSGQIWAAFLRTHATDIWACNVLPVTDLLFRHAYASVVGVLASRRVVHVAVTRPPSAAWVAQQLREAPPFGQHPAFARVAADSGIDSLRTADRRPR